MTGTGTERLASLARLWRSYARKVYGPDYPLYQAVADAVAADPEVLELVLEGRPEAHDPNMLLAAVQYLVLGGAQHPLADLYGRAASFADSPPPGELQEWLHDFCLSHRDRLRGLLDSRHVQTNETGRCGGLALGLMAAARRIGAPLAVIDDGTSAGLNLALDEYLLDFGPPGRLGPSQSPVHLTTEALGRALPVPLELPPIARRLGIDRAPVDLDDDDAVRWLLACIWPGNRRQDRARAAVGLGRAHRYQIRRGDMVDDLADALEGMHPLPTVVITSWSYSYLPLEARDRFTDVLSAAGQVRPVAWVCCDLMGTVPMLDPGDPPPAGPSVPSVLGLAVFRAGTVEAHGLAYMHSHGSWLHWLGTDQYGSL